MSNSLALKVYSDPRTVLTLGEISQLVPDVVYKNVRRRATYLVKSGKLFKLHQGIYAKPKYNPLEVVSKIYKPSYISLETVLAKEGIVFQYYETLFAVSYLTREVKLNGNIIQYRRIDRKVLTNPEGVEEKDGYFIATCARAFLDAVFIYKNYFFDNLGGLDWDKVFKLVPVYDSKALDKRVKEYYKHYQEDYGKS